MSKPGERQHLFDKPENVRRLLWSLYGACSLLLLVDLILQRHTEHAFEEIPAFYPIFGFVACVTLVLVAKCLRTWLKRSEHYYDGDPDDSD